MWRDSIYAGILSNMKLLFHCELRVYLVWNPEHRTKASMEL